MPLLLGLDVSSLTMSLINIPSPRGAETPLADSIESALRAVAHLEVERTGDCVIARTDAGRPERVVVAGHLGTAASVADPMAYVEMGKLFGPGASDAKGALAVALKAAAAGGFARDVTFVFHADAQFAPQAELDRADLLVVAAPTASAVVGAAADDPLVRRLIELTDVAPTSSGEAYGLARLASLGAPAVAFGPGDPSVAGTDGEFVPTAQLSQCEFVLRSWLQG